jgi:hypothetical protein
MIQELETLSEAIVFATMLWISELAIGFNNSFLFRRVLLLLYTIILDMLIKLWKESSIILGFSISYSFFYEFYSSYVIIIFSCFSIFGIFEFSDFYSKFSIFNFYV